MPGWVASIGISTPSALGVSEKGLVDMSSGQQRVNYTDKERALSDDQITQQNFIARERNEILRALVQRSYSRFGQPGVSVRAEGAVGTPLAGVVIDGLEVLVDTPGNLLVSPGTLAVWNGTPGASEDSGFIVIVDDGVTTLGSLLIATNAGASPRCDVIECQPAIDAVSTTQSRDVYNESTEDFEAANVVKFYRSRLTYRVRQGTAGTPPGYAAGWLPIALAIVQPGATVAQIDYYDVRPLLRELGDSTSKSASATHPILVSTGNSVSCAGASPIADSVIDGVVEVELDGMKFGGWLTYNSPISAATLAAFGTQDLTPFSPTDRNTVRGSGFSAAATDTVVLAAWMPDLGSSGIYLPRCVRYSQGVPTSPALPARRRPYGANGILLAIATSQDDWATTLAARIASPLTLAAAGIGGCLGAAYGVPLMFADVTGTTLETKLYGDREGTGYPVRGLPKTQNRIVSTGFHVTPTSGFAQSTAAATMWVAVTNGSFTLSLRKDDIVLIDIGPLILQCSAAAGGGMFRVVLTETDESPLPYETTLLDDHAHYYTTPLRHVATKTCTLTVALEISGVTSPATTMSIATDSPNWARHLQIRP